MVLGLSAFATPHFVSARELTTKEVSAAVATWVKTCAPDAKPEAVVRSAVPYMEDGVTLAYVVEFTLGGYCLAGADDLSLPVTLYNPLGTYNPNNPQLEEFLHGIAARTRQVRQAADSKGSPDSLTAAIKDRPRIWQDLIAGRKPTAGSTIDSRAPKDFPPPAGTTPAVMELPLTSRWNQIEPYNGQVPLHPIANQRTAVGCNGTAQAQIMYYWKWPLRGTGSASVTYEYRWRTSWDEQPLAANPGIPADWAGGGVLEWTTNNGGRLRMNGAWDDSRRRAAEAIKTNNVAYSNALAALWGRLNVGSTQVTADFTVGYNWELLRNIHPSTPAGDVEAAKLSAHAAISSHSDFGISGTGSSLWLWSLQTNFFYSPDILFYPSTTNESVSQFIKEIKWLRPVALGGWGPPGGHAYVLYGYDTVHDPNNVYFLFNMGWSVAEGHIWYALDDPAYFPNSQDHLIRIAPANVVRFVGNTVSGSGSPASPHLNIEEALASAPDGATLIFKADTVNTFSASRLVINRPLTLRGFGARITKQ